MKKLLCFIALLILPAVALTDDSVFFTLVVQPDVMVILDCSGSMTWDMNGTPTWGDGSEDYPGLDTDGNGYSDDARLYIAKNAIHRIVQKREKFRWGLETYPGQKYGPMDWADWYRDTTDYTDSIKIPCDYTGDGYDNGQVLVNIAEAEPAHLQSISDYVDNKGPKELMAQGGTPIGGALFVAQQFYKGWEIPADNAKECRRYFCIVVSDGKETGWPDSNSHSPYKEARNLRYTMVDGEEYDIQTYVVGIAVPGGEGAQCLDSIARCGGTIHYYSAMSQAQLDSVLDIIASDILQKSFAFSAPEVPAVRIKQNDKLYIGSFIPSYSAFWEGRLKCYRLAPDGSLPVDPLGVPLEEPIWDAGEKLKAKSSDLRNIYTEKNGSRVPFRIPYVDGTMLGVPDTAVTDLINWVRGDNGMDWKLGDIFHSEPVAITSPNPFYFEEGYNDFKITYANRDRVILAAANDGMLHAFDAGEIAASDSFTDGTGDEVWAYIPHNLLPKLKDMRNSHQYMVDASPSAADVWIPLNTLDFTKDEDEWRTILVCGERSGGNHYFSLDITHTNNPDSLRMWEFTDTELGETWSKARISKIRIKETGAAKDKWVTVFGGGFHPNNEKGRALYFLDISDGDIIFKYDSTDNADIQYSFPSAPNLLDMPPLDNFVDRVYIGDMGGQMWRFDVSDSNTS
ncbi:hypothetical protein CH333_02835, partial [candidate division WOR-3 bacterium JGI_Cruoil_03_44_89]